MTSITFEGDSTIYGIGAPAGQDEPSDVAKILGVAVINDGVSGTTAEENIYGEAPFTSTLATRLATDPSQIVVMNYAINDSARDTLDQYEQNLYDWVATVRAAGKIPVFEEPNPSSLAAYQAAMPPFVEAMDRAGQQLNVLVIPQYSRIMAMPNWQAILTDGLHPDALGYQIKAIETAAVLQTLM